MSRSGKYPSFKVTWIVSKFSQQHRFTFQVKTVYLTVNKNINIKRGRIVMTAIFVDADACPVVSETIQVAREYNLKCTLICDTAHEIHREGAETIIVSKGADAVDFVLVNRVQKNDIVVTQDYGLAAMVLAKQGHPIDQNGRLYTEENIDQLLYARHKAQKIRMSGGRLRGPKKRPKENNIRFSKSLRQLCERLSAIEE